MKSFIYLKAFDLYDEFNVVKKECAERLKSKIDKAIKFDSMN